MSAKCTNCGTAITCSCQVRKSSDGTNVCSKCITSYEVSKNNLAVITAAVFPES